MTTLFTPVSLAGPRFWVRHVHENVVQFLTEQLGNLGWVTAPVNFGTVPVKIEEVALLPTGDPAVDDLKPNTVSITPGDTSDEQAEEMGGGIISLAVPIFVDVFGEKAGIAVSIADDMRRVMSDNSIPLYDFSAKPAPELISGAYIEFEQVVGPRQPAAAGQAMSAIRRNWRVTKATAVAYLMGDS